jgi:hypothetical protein
LQSEIKWKLDRRAYWCAVALLLLAEFATRFFPLDFRPVLLLGWASVYVLRARGVGVPVYWVPVVLGAQVLLIIGPAFIIPEAYLHYVEGAVGSVSLFERMIFFGSIGLGYALQIAFAVWLGLRKPVQVRVQPESVF